MRALAVDWPRGLANRLAGSRRMLLAALCAVLLLVTCATLLAVASFSARPRTPRTVMAAPTATLTATASATPTRRATSTRTPLPVTNVVIHTPPPPTPPAATPTVTACTPTPVPTATATVPPTATATATTAPTATGSPPTGATGYVPLAVLAGNSVAACSTCPWYAGNNPSRSAIQSALAAAADAYHLPRNLVYSVAWQESTWHEDVTSCDGGVGLMQIQYYYADYFNGLSYPACGLSATSYDIHTLMGNANLGAKVLAYLKCYYTFGGPYGGTPSSPANGSSEYNYVAAGLAYPDSAAPKSVCVADFNDARQAYPTGLFPDLPSTTAQPWSCPYDPTIAGDSTLVDLVLSAYNAGQGAIYNCQCIPNPWYVASVEGYIPQFFTGTLPG